MTPEEFKRRYIDFALSAPGLDELPELRESLGEFISFDRTTLAPYGLHPDDQAFLLSAGLPRDAGPYLNFPPHGRKELDWLRDTYKLPQDFLTLGHNNSGDLVGIEVASRAVVYLMHDDDLNRVFVNSSLPQFAESLCLFQESSRARQIDRFLARLQELDPPAAAPGTMWHTESQDRRPNCPAA